MKWTASTTSFLLDCEGWQNETDCWLHQNAGALPAGRRQEARRRDPERRKTHVITARLSSEKAADAVKSRIKGSKSESELRDLGESTGRENVNTFAPDPVNSKTANYGTVNTEGDKRDVESKPPARKHGRVRRIRDSSEDNAVWKRRAQEAGETSVREIVIDDVCCDLHKGRTCQRLSPSSSADPRKGTSTAIFPECPSSDIDDLLVDIDGKSSALKTVEPTYCSSRSGGMRTSSSRFITADTNKSPGVVDRNADSNVSKVPLKASYGGNSRSPADGGNGSSSSEYPIYGTVIGPKAGKDSDNYGTVGDSIGIVDEKISSKDASRKTYRHHHHQPLPLKTVSIMDTLSELAGVTGQHIETKNKHSLSGPERGGKTQEWITQIFGITKKGDLPALQRSTAGLGSAVLRNLADSNGNTILHVLCCLGHVNVLQWLLASMPSTADALYDHNKFRQTPVVCAIKLLSWLAHYMAQSDAGLDGKDHHGNTALHLAARTGDSGLCSLLLQHGADLTIKNDLGQKAWEVCVVHGHTACAEYLCVHEAGLALANDLTRREAELEAANSDNNDLRIGFKEVVSVARRLLKEREEAVRELSRLSERIMSVERHLAVVATSRIAVRVEESLNETGQQADIDEFSNKIVSDAAILYDVDIEELDDSRNGQDSSVFTVQDNCQFSPLKCKTNSEANEANEIRDSIDAAVHSVTTLRERWQAAQKIWFGSSLVDLKHRMLLVEETWKKLRHRSHRTVATAHHPLDVFRAQVLNVRSQGGEGRLGDLPSLCSSEESIPDLLPFSDNEDDCEEYVITREQPDDMFPIYEGIFGATDGTGTGSDSASSISRTRVSPSISTTKRIIAANSVSSSVPISSAIVNHSDLTTHSDSIQRFNIQTSHHLPRKLQHTNRLKSSEEILAAAAKKREAGLQALRSVMERDLQPPPLQRRTDNDRAPPPPPPLVPLIRRGALVPPELVFNRSEKKVPMVLGQGMNSYEDRGPAPQYSTNNIYPNFKPSSQGQLSKSIHIRDQETSKPSVSVSRSNSSSRRRLAELCATGLIDRGVKESKLASGYGYIGNTLVSQEKTVVPTLRSSESVRCAPNIEAKKLNSNLENERIAILRQLALMSENGSCSVLEVIESSLSEESEGEDDNFSAENRLIFADNIGHEKSVLDEFSLYSEVKSRKTKMAPENRTKTFISNRSSKAGHRVTEDKLYDRLSNNKLEGEHFLACEASAVTAASDASEIKDTQQRFSRKSLENCISDDEHNQDSSLKKKSFLHKFNIKPPKWPTNRKKLVKSPTFQAKQDEFIMKSDKIGNEQHPCTLQIYSERPKHPIDKGGEVSDARSNSTLRVAYDQNTYATSDETAQNKIPESAKVSSNVLLEKAHSRSNASPLSSSVGSDTVKKLTSHAGGNKTATSIISASNRDSTLFVLSQNASSPMHAPKNCPRLRVFESSALTSELNHSFSPNANLTSSTPGRSKEVLPRESDQIQVRHHLSPSDTEQYSMQITDSPVENVMESLEDHPSDDEARVDEVVDIHEDEITLPIRHLSRHHHHTLQDDEEGLHRNEHRDLDFELRPESSASKCELILSRPASCASGFPAYTCKASDRGSVEYLQKSSLSLSQDTTGSCRMSPAPSEVSKTESALSPPPSHASSEVSKSCDASSSSSRLKEGMSRGVTPVSKDELFNQNETATKMNLNVKNQSFKNSNVNSDNVLEETVLQGEQNCSSVNERRFPSKQSDVNNGMLSKTALSDEIDSGRSNFLADSDSHMKNSDPQRSVQRKIYSFDQRALDDQRKTMSIVRSEPEAESGTLSQTKMRVSETYFSSSPKEAANSDMERLPCSVANVNAQVETQNVLEGKQKTFSQASNSSGGNRHGLPRPWYEISDEECDQDILLPDPWVIMTQKLAHVPSSSASSTSDEESATIC